ncbi:hypothetical protein E1A91_A05G312800v1 [Gossypium mustelinum]|nr:hypothetical protein E1A91_A05G312800v1 [Gossypium mustelinum]
MNKEKNHNLPLLPFTTFLHQAPQVTIPPTLSSHSCSILVCYCFLFFFGLLDCFFHPQLSLLYSLNR